MAEAFTRYTFGTKIKIFFYKILRIPFHSALRRGFKFYAYDGSKKVLMKVDERGFYRAEEEKWLSESNGLFYTYLKNVAKVNSVELSEKILLEIIMEMVSFEYRFSFFDPRRIIYEERGEDQMFIYFQGKRFLIPFNKFYLRIFNPDDSNSSIPIAERYKIFFDSPAFIEDGNGIGLKIEESEIPIIGDWIGKRRGLLSSDLYLIGSTLKLKDHFGNIDFLISKDDSPSSYMSSIGNFNLLPLIVFLIVREFPKTSRSRLEEFSKMFQESNKKVLSGAISLSKLSENVLEFWVEYEAMAEILDQSKCADKDLRKATLREIFDKLDF